MAKIPAKNTNITIDGNPLEDDIDNYTLGFTQETPVVTGLSDAGPRRVVGNYDYDLAVSGAADLAASQSDATLFGMVGSSGVTMGVDPTGEAAGANDPHYDSTSIVLGSYQISGAVGGRVEFSATMMGNAVIARTVA